MQTGNRNTTSQMIQQGWQQSIMGTRSREGQVLFRKLAGFMENMLSADGKVVKVVKFPHCISNLEMTFDCLRAQQQQTFPLIYGPSLTQGTITIT